MRGIIKREFRAYFQSPLGYVFIAAFIFMASYYFFTYNLLGNTTNFTSLFSMLFSVVLFLCPILTMRLMSEDKKNKTDQLLLTSPIPLGDIVTGKYLAALSVYGIACFSVVIDALIASAYGKVEWATVIGNIAGLLFLGMALISVCLFLSSLTESQVIAAVSGFAVSLFLLLIGSLADVVSSPVAKRVIHYVAFSNRYEPFTYGIFDLTSVVFFLSFTLLFLVMSTVTLEKRRWS